MAQCSATSRRARSMNGKGVVSCEAEARILSRVVQTFLRPDPLPPCAPQNADLEKRLARLDRQCLKQLEARAKAARNVKVVPTRNLGVFWPIGVHELTRKCPCGSRRAQLKEEVTYRKLYSIASAAGLAGSFRPINYVPKGKLASKTCGRSPRAFMEPVAPTQKGSQALARDLAAPRSPSLLGSTAASKGARPKHHRVDNAAGGSRYERSFLLSREAD